MEMYPGPLPLAKGQTFLWELLVKILTALTTQRKTNTVVLESTASKYNLREQISYNWPKKCPQSIVELNLLPLFFIFITLTIFLLQSDGLGHRGWDLWLIIRGTDGQHRLMHPPSYMELLSPGDGKSAACRGLGWEVSPPVEPLWAGRWWMWAQPVQNERMLEKVYHFILNAEVWSHLCSMAAVFCSHTEY